jgi:hypothetical protein
MCTSLKLAPPVAPPVVGDNTDAVRCARVRELPLNKEEVVREAGERTKLESVVKAMRDKMKYRVSVAEELARLRQGPVAPIFQTRPPPLHDSSRKCCV